MINKEPFNTLLKTLKDTGKYRVFNDIIREKGKFPSAMWYGPYNIKNITSTNTMTMTGIMPAPLLV